MRAIIDHNYERALAILTENRTKLDRMAEALIRFETIDETQIRDVMEGRSPRPPEDWSDSDEEDDSSNSTSAEEEGSDGDEDSGSDTSIGGPANQH